LTIIQSEEEKSSTRQVETRRCCFRTTTGRVEDWQRHCYRTDHSRVPFPIYREPLQQATLVWRLDNEGSRSQRVEVSYLTDGVNWKADYVLTVARDTSRPISTAG